jgi:hypothetical protein
LPKPPQHQVVTLQSRDGLVEGRSDNEASSVLWLTHKLKLGTSTGGNSYYVVLETAMAYSMMIIHQALLQEATPRR